MPYNILRITKSEGGKRGWQYDAVGKDQTKGAHNHSTVQAAIDSFKEDHPDERYVVYVDDPDSDEKYSELVTPTGIESLSGPDTLFEDDDEDEE